MTATISLSEMGFLAAAAFCLMALSAGLCVALGRLVIPRLVKLKINDGENRKASEYLAMLHGGKKNTPTMGGIFLVPVVMVALLGAAALAMFAPGVLGQNGPTIAGACVLLAAVTLANGALGFVDDYRKLKKLGKDGLSGRVKLAAQTLIACAACAAALLWLGPDTFVVRLPFATIEPGWWLAPVGAFVIVGTGNAFNLTDGLDGLAGGTGGVAFFALGGGALMLALFGGAGGLGFAAAIAALAASGALVGFLYWNRYPARVFMGDTGSLSLGALMGFIAVLSGLELVLAVAGGVFVVEAMSVILQVGYFKATGGKRIFKCSPLHHHFQFSGWHETRVTRHFIGAAVACAIIAVALSVTMLVPRPQTQDAPAAAEPEQRRVPGNAVVGRR